MRSGSSRTALPLPLPLVLVALAPLVAGCVSTQTRNARTLIESYRTLDSQKPVIVRAALPSVTVTSVSLVPSRTRTAIVVQLRSSSRVPLSDLPINVSVRSRGHSKVLNGRANLPYYDTHVASIAAQGTSTWVFVTRKPVPADGRASAIVGAATSPASTTVSTLPAIRVTAAAGVSAELSLQVANTTGVPQFGLPVYAVASRDGRIVAAGAGSVASLGGGDHATTQVKLLGRASGASLALSAPATIFK